MLKHETLWPFFSDHTGCVSLGGAAWRVFQPGSAGADRGGNASLNNRADGSADGYALPRPDFVPHARNNRDARADTHARAYADPDTGRATHVFQLCRPDLLRSRDGHREV